MKLELTKAEAIMVRDALRDAYIDLRTDPDTGVVMRENDFLDSDASRQRIKRYLALRGLGMVLDIYIMRSV